MIILSNSKKIAKVGSNFCQILTNPQKYYQRYKKFPKWQYFAHIGYMWHTVTLTRMALPRIAEPAGRTGRK